MDERDRRGEGRQPEAEASLEAAARAGSKKPDGQGLHARPDTAPKPGSLEGEQTDAAEILRSGAERATGARADRGGDPG